MSNRRAAAQSGIWSIVLQWSRFGLNTLVFLILARWLSLAEIGAFAVAFAPVNLLQLVQRTSFSETVVQGRTDSPAFLDTIFWMSAGFGLMMSACLFALSFAIGPIMGIEASGTYLAAMAVIPALVGVAAVPEGLLRKRLEIRTLALRTASSLTVAGLVALWLGYAGYGGWALTAFAIINALLSSVLVAVLVRWRPGARPRRAEARTALPLLMVISGQKLANGSTMPLLQLLVGAVLGPVAAGAFQIAERFLMLAATITVTPLQFAALPVFVRVRDDAERLRRVITETAGLVSFASAPIHFGLLAVAPTLLPLAVGAENATETVPVLQAFLLVGGQVGLSAVFVQSMIATSRSDIALRWSFSLFALNMLVGGITVMFSGTLVALGYSLIGYAAAPFAMGVLSRHLGVSRIELAKAVLGPVAIAAAMALGVFAFRRFFAGGMTDLLLLAAEIGVGIMIYAVLSLLVSRAQIMATRSLLVALLPRRRQA